MTDRPPAASVAFDRAAAYYDRTRAVSPGALAGSVELLAPELAGSGRCLEVGVGTGTIALALAGAGIPMAGVDLAVPMLAKLVEKAGGRPPFPLATADATRLPFRDDAFGGAVLRHVLHLVPRWRGVVEELARVVRPGGVVLASLGGFEEAWAIVDRFCRLAGIPFSVGLDPRDESELDDAFASHGAEVRVLPPVPDPLEEPVGRFLEETERGVHSWSWRVPDDVRRGLMPEVRAFAVERFGSLDRPLDPRHAIVWRAYRLSA